MKRRKKITLFVVLGVVVVAALAAVSMMNGGEETTMVQVDLAYRDELVEQVTASGRIQPQTKVDITSEVSAEIVELYAKEGDRVVRGQALLQLDTIQLKSDVTQASFSLDEITARKDAAKTQFERDRLEDERQTRLYEQNLTSETAYTNARLNHENSKANFEAMQAQVKTQQARLEKAQDNLAKTLIDAPMAGVITYHSAEVGEIAQAQTSFTQGRTLMTVADLSIFEVEVDVDETEIARIKLGQPADIRVDAFRDTVYDGTVVEIGNSARVVGEGTDNFTTNFLVKIRFNESNVPMRPGMSATVDITTAKEEDALLIPYAALVMREIDVDAKKTSKSDEDSSGGLVGEVQAAEADSEEDETGAMASTDSASNDDAAETTQAKPKDRKEPEKVKKLGVFLVKDGKARFVEIERGIADDKNVVALSGVNAKDTVVSGSYQTLRKLKDGELVQIKLNSLEDSDSDD